LLWPDQVHGRGVIDVDAELVARLGGASEGGVGEADALVTSVAGVALGVLVADCMPVLLADPFHGVVGSAHAGRRGLAAGVLDATVDAMEAAGAVASQITAIIGPAICGGCYEVPAAMRAEVSAVIPECATTTRDGKPALDLPAGALACLRARGVSTVRRIELCTREDPRFYSYRRDRRTGRFAGVAMVGTDV